MSTGVNQDRTVAGLLGALRFAAERHAGQQRKDLATPYINHPIAVAEALAGAGGVTDLKVLQAAVLHDTLEDTETSPKELEERFGHEVLLLVQEVTDDKSVPREQRKRLQVAHAPSLSHGAKQIKIADKLCNILDISATQPPDWPLRRKREYLDWAEEVVAACRGANPPLEQAFQSALTRQRAALEG